MALAPDIRRRMGIYGPRDPRPIEKDGIDVTALNGVRSQWMDITPEMAARWLKNNFRNRPIRWDTVKAYARDMLNGNWVPTHQGLAFNDQDALIDGQHRLHAIVMAKMTVRMMVTFGVPSKIDGKEMTTMDAVDRGATRSVGDQLTIQHGLKHGSITASVCSAVGSLCFGERTRRLSVGANAGDFAGVRAGGELRDRASVESAWIAELRRAGGICVCAGDGRGDLGRQDADQ
ncbi:MAG TPA: hypothetical protein VG167_18840 [Verrucomicrobiae bacterium]|nr:hypothetical protein [Verrucomicrobiae bacterium]